MKNFKALMAGLSVFALLTACGEGFKAANLASIQETADSLTAEDNAKKELTSTQAREADLRRILESYQNEISTTNSNSNLSLAADIRALNLNIQFSESPVGDQSINYITAVMQGADRNQNFSTGLVRTVTLSGLKSLRRQDIGEITLSGRLLDIEIQCTDSSCNTIVLAAREYGEEGAEAIALYVLDGQNPQASTGRSFIRSFFSVQAGVEFYSYTLTPLARRDVFCEYSSTCEPSGSNHGVLVDGWASRIRPQNQQSSSSPNPNISPDGFGQAVGDRPSSESSFNSVDAGSGPESSSETNWGAWIEDRKSDYTRDSGSDNDWFSTEEESSQTIDSQHWWDI